MAGLTVHPSVAVFPSLLPIPSPLLLCPWDHLFSQGLFLGKPKLRCGDNLGNGESKYIQIHLQNFFSYLFSYLASLGLSYSRIIYL